MTDHLGVLTDSQDWFFYDMEDRMAYSMVFAFSGDGDSGLLVSDWFEDDPDWFGPELRNRRLGA